MTPVVRIALGVSVVWLVAGYFLSEADPGIRWFLLLGVLPVVVFWVLYWLISGLRKDKAREARRFRLRITWWK